MERTNIIFFDGICNLCNSSVNFIMDRDKNARFKFVALQDEKAQHLLAEYGVNESNQSILFLENGKIFDRSNAVLRISKKMDGFWPVFWVFMFLPKFIRDSLYNFIAKHRYKWFGKRESCRLPGAEDADRFL